MRAARSYSLIVVATAGLLTGMHGDGVRSPAAVQLCESDAARAHSRLDRRSTATRARALDLPPAADQTLEHATPIDLPHFQSGVAMTAEPTPIALRFEAATGQTLAVEIAARRLDGGRAAEPLEVDLFFIEPRRAAASFREIAVEPRGVTAQATIDRSGDYVLRIQPPSFANLVYGFTVELGALTFPIAARSSAVVQSSFGASRDAGARSHEGVDIFADRMTPVVAVADGRAVPGRNRLGGNIVWLNTAGVSYYYAHLERTAFDRPRRVRSGDVLGYVGNSGNAARTPPHLHFGVYRWGDGAIDPMPSLLARRFEDTDPLAAALPREPAVRDTVRHRVVIPDTHAPRLVAAAPIVRISPRIIGRVLPRAAPSRDAARTDLDVATLRRSGLPLWISL